jgi:hypothetical protein
VKTGKSLTSSVLVFPVIAKGGKDEKFNQMPPYVQTRSSRQLSPRSVSSRMQEVCGMLQWPKLAFKIVCLLTGGREASEPGNELGAQWWKTEIEQALEEVTGGAAIDRKF